MNAKTYQPSNRFSDRVSIATAAVEWQGLSSQKQELVTVNDGLPFLAGCPDLSDRAAALLDAAQRGKITGLVTNEDGYPLRAEIVQLDRSSVAAFIKKLESKPAPVVPASSDTGEVLLRSDEVQNRLGIKRATFFNWLKVGKLEKAHLDNPPRWRKSYIDSIIQGSTTKPHGDI